MMIKNVDFEMGTLIIQVGPIDGRGHGENVTTG